MHTRAYIYDINLNDWMDDLVAYDGPTHYGGLYTLKGGYVARWTDDYTYQPFDARHFIILQTTPPDVGFTEAMDLKENRDLLLCQMGNFLTSDAVSVSIYDPGQLPGKNFHLMIVNILGMNPRFIWSFGILIPNFLAHLTILYINGYSIPHL
ncbi:MAG: hypothetical protein IPI23_01780 [Bacteroidetes bacterium]|nr:hypothetical protein [Bacteroidota bacterium]